MSWHWVKYTGVTFLPVGPFLSLQPSLKTRKQYLVMCNTHGNTHYVSYFSLQGLFYWLTSGLQNCLDLWPDQNDNIGKKGLEKRGSSNKTESMELLWENAIFEYRRTICVETQPEKQRILRQDTKSPEQSCLREQTNIKGHILPEYLLTDREHKMIKEIHE